ncbi:MAG: methionyl-tRNA formyltransferase [Pseudomonadota bacterium]
MNIVFAGTPDFAVHALNALYAAGHTVVGVFTQPDKPQGRHQHLTPSPVKVCAQLHGTQVFQPKSLKSAEAQAELRQLNPDVMVVAAYGLLLPKAVLDMPTYGCINIHASLLPRWRGASPITQAILAGDRQAGVTLMVMDEGLDTGPMIATQACALDGSETTGSLTEQLAQMGSDLLIKTLPNLAHALEYAQIQPNIGVMHAPKIRKEEACISWETSAVVLERRLRAFDPWPGNYSYINEVRLQLWQASATDVLSTTSPGTIQYVDNTQVLVSCNDTCLSLTTVQLAGKKRAPIKEILRGYPNLFVLGQRFTVSVNSAGTSST